MAQTATSSTDTAAWRLKLKNLAESLATAYDEEDPDTALLELTAGDFIPRSRALVAVAQTDNDFEVTQDYTKAQYSVFDDLADEFIPTLMIFMPPLAISSGSGIFVLTAAPSQTGAVDALRGAWAAVRASVDSLQETVIGFDKYSAEEKDEHPEILTYLKDSIMAVSISLDALDAARKWYVDKDGGQGIRELHRKFGAVYNSGDESLGEA